MLLPGIRSIVASTRPPLTTIFTGCLPDFLAPSSAYWTQDRGRKRNKKKGITKEQRRERKLLRDEAEEKRRQNKAVFKAAMRDTIVKSKTNESSAGRTNYPKNSRYLPLDMKKQAELIDKPLTNAYFINEVKMEPMPFRKVVDFYKAVTDKSMTKDQFHDIVIKVFCELDMNAERSGKYIHSATELVNMPYPFKYFDRRTVMAFIKDKNLADKAKENGCDKVLGTDSIKKIIRGVVKMDDYDFCLASYDMATYLASMRGVLGNKLPTKINGGLTENLIETLERFKTGIRITITRDTKQPAFGTAIAAFGRTQMPFEEIEANFQYIISKICSRRNPVIGPFIVRAKLVVQGINPKRLLHVDVTPYLPVAKQEDIDKYEENKKKKEKKKPPKIAKVAKIKIIPLEHKLKKFM